MFDLKNKTAIITGGGSGIGRAVCLLFARQDAEVHIVDINTVQMQETAELIKNTGSNCFTHLGNVAIQQEVTEIYHQIGKVDVLVNNAGISHIGNAENTMETDFDRIFNVNVKGVYNSLYAAIPLMKKNKGGVILNMSSVAATVGISDRFAYSMSKGAVYAMTMSVAKDYIHNNIRCNCISPGRVHTPFVDNYLAKTYPGKEEEMFEKLARTQPIGRMGTTEEIAHLVLYLCSDEAAFITGSDYPIDGGFIKLNN